MNLSFIVLIVFIIVACLLASRLTTKFGLPTLLIFMVLGMLFGVDGIFKLDFDNFELAEAVCSFALVFIMFDGGFGTNWKNAKPVAAKSFVLATIGVVITAAITAVFCYFALGFDLLTSLLLGSVISSTDAASVFSVLKQKKLWLKENTTSLLALESGSNDPASYLLTVLSLTLLAGQNAASIGGLVAAQLCFALLFGVILAVGTVFVLQKTKFSVDGFDTILVLAAAVAAYAIPAMLGGNGYLSVYLFGLIVGNSKIKNKVTLVHFFDGVTGLAQMLVFFLLGLLVTPSNLPVVILPSVALFLFLTFVSRPAAVFSLLALSKKQNRSSARQMAVVSWAGLRGASSIVFAVIAVVGGASSSIFEIVFCVCIMSVALQGWTFPSVAKKLGMVDAPTSTLKTFNDYIENRDMQLLRISISENHPWVGKTVREMSCLTDTLIVFIKRGDKAIIPKGNTKIQAGDAVILGGAVYSETADVTLYEKSITKGHEFADRLVSEIKMPENVLIVGVRRKKGKTIIPKGNTRLCQGDTLILCKGEFVEEVKPDEKEVPAQQTLDEAM